MVTKSWKSFPVALVLCAGIMLALQPVARAVDVQFQINIQAGMIGVSMRDGSRNIINNPVIAMSAIVSSTKCQAVGATLGTDDQRLYIDNPSAATGGWTLTIAAQEGRQALWKSTSSPAQFDYNDQAVDGQEAGCKDGPDGDSIAGQLRVSPSGSVIHADCSSCSASNIVKGSDMGFEDDGSQSATILNANSGSDDVGSWYLTGVELQQQVPPGQQAGSYFINMSITAAAI